MKYMLLNIAYALDVVKSSEATPAEVSLSELLGYNLSV